MSSINDRLGGKPGEDVPPIDMAGIVSDIIEARDIEKEQMEEEMNKHGAGN